MTDTIEITTPEDVLTNLAQTVESAQAAHNVARSAADAARQAVADAESTVKDYKDRIASGLPTTATTLASKLDALTLAELALPGAEQRENAALSVLREATIALVTAQVAEHPLLSGAAAEGARQKAAALLAEARQVLVDFVVARNSALADARTKLDACDAPVAVAATMVKPLIINSHTDSPVHRLNGRGDDRGVLVRGREFLPNNPRYWADTLIAKEIRKMLSAKIRAEIDWV